MNKITVGNCMFQKMAKGGGLVSLDFFENAMAHPRMKVQVLLRPIRPLAEKNNFKKSVGKYDF